MACSFDSVDGIPSVASAVPTFTSTAVGVAGVAVLGADWKS